MTKSYCVVTGCSSGYTSDRKRRKREGLKNPSLFSVPEDPSVFKKWSAVIPLKNNVLTFQDKVCEEHFKESDIVREHILGFSTYERKKVILKPDAVPSIFEISPRYQTYKSKEIKPTLKCIKDRHCKKVNLENGEELLVSDLDESEIVRKNEKESLVGKKGIPEINKIISTPVSKIIIHSPNYQTSQFIKRKMSVECMENVDKRWELVIPDIDKSEIEQKIAKEFPSSLKHCSGNKRDLVKTDAVPSTFRNLLNSQVSYFKKRKRPVEFSKNVDLENRHSKNIKEIVPAPGIENGSERKKLGRREEKNTYLRRFVPIKPKPVHSINSPDNESKKRKPPVECSKNVYLEKIKEIVHVPGFESDSVRKKLDRRGDKNTYVRKFVPIKPKPVHSINSPNNQDNESKKSQPCVESIQDFIPQKINLEKTEKYVIHKVDNVLDSYPEFSYSFLVENLDAVIKPSNRWGVTSHGDFIIYVYWNMKFEPEKKIIFNSKLEIRVFLLDYELQEVYAVRSLADVIQLIRCIENYTICAGYRNRRDNCQIYMQKNRLEGSKIYCTFCEVEQKDEQQLQQRTQQELERKKQLGSALESSKESILVSKKELYQRITCEKRKHARLIKKVLSLKRKLNNQSAFEKFCMSEGLSDDEC